MAAVFRLTSKHRGLNVLKRSRAKRCFSLKKHLKKQKAVGIQSHMELLAKTVQTNPKFRLDLYKVGEGGGINHG